MARIYVAASNEDKKEARWLMKIIASKNHVVHDWTIGDNLLSLKEKVKSDLHVLLNSDVVVFVNAKRVTPGKYIEIGACRATGKDVIFIGNPRGILGDFGTVVEDIPGYEERVLDCIEKLKVK